MKTNRWSADPLIDRLLQGIFRPVAAKQLDPTVIFERRPISLYLHFPFCGSFCAYCTFNKARPRQQMTAYVEAVEREIAYYAHPARLGTVEVNSMYIGGGTPSYPPADLIERLLAAVHRGLSLRPGLQITIESNPESIELDKLRRYRAAGINRVSVGVQTFDEPRLRMLGRQHRPRDIHRALDVAREAGFEEISIDLMYGLPEQSIASFSDDLARAVAAPITHLSLFPMIYRSNTPIFRRRSGKRPLWSMYDRALDTLAAAGFEQYSTEDFTRSGVRCAYQVDSWTPPTLGCLGLGAGALSTFNGYNWHNVGDVELYIATASHERPPLAGGAPCSVRQQMYDQLLMATKTLRIDPAIFEHRFGVRFGSIAQPWLTMLRAARMLRRDGDGTFTLTRRGRFYASLFWSEFILAKLTHAASDPAMATAPAPEISRASTERKTAIVADDRTQPSAGQLVH